MPLGRLVTQSGSKLKKNVFPLKVNRKVSPFNMLKTFSCRMLIYKVTQKKLLLYSISAKLKRKYTDEKETYPHWKTFDCLIFQTLILISITQSLFIVPKTENQCSEKPVFDCQDSIHFSILERLYILKSKLLKSYAEIYLFFGTEQKIMHWWVL